MPVKPGERLGPFEIVGAVGSGGMGDVYRARDLTLRREVALKILPDAFVQDQERVSRLRREAQVLASLNHPNIATLYGIEESADVHALVLELVDGPTLADRIAAGPMPLREVLEVAGQLVDALAAAHERGIVHRDLKPANIIVRPDGTVKVLDFGLAKAADPGRVPLDATGAATVTTPPMTAAGVIMGTAPYMSPEQARGHAADARSDIWAFGAVVYEMLSGERAFGGATVSDTLASILTAEPSWTALPPSTPRAVRRAVRSCLAKDPRRRLQSIADWRLLLEDDPAPQPTRSLPRSTLVAGVLAAMLAIGLAALAFVYVDERPTRSATAPPARATIPLPPGSELGRSGPSLALSADGRRLAFVAARGGSSQLYVRELAGSESVPIAGTAGASSPFFSPDGQWIGFFAQGKLKKVPAAGGLAEVLCDAPVGMGADWGADDTIYFVPFNTSGVWKVGASGGQPEEVTRLDRQQGEVSHRWPQVLPGGQAILFTVWVGPGRDEQSVQLQVLATGERRLLARGGSTGRYVHSGHLVYSGVQSLMALPFDLSRLEVTEETAVVLPERAWQGTEGAVYAVSAAGIVAYAPSRSSTDEGQLVWIDRAGNAEVLAAPPRPYRDPRISPDGRQVAVSIAGGTHRVWIYDFERATLTAVTAADVSSQFPVWTPDGARLLYRGTRGGLRNLFWRAADGSDDETRLTTGENLQAPMSITPDGALAAFLDIDPATGEDIWLVSLDGDHHARPFLRTAARENYPRFSPDGRWLAYSSDDSGRWEIYVQPFPGPGGRTTISTQGGTVPVWSRDGTELFYRNGSRIMAVSVSTAGGLRAGVPRQVLESPFDPGFDATSGSGFDVSLDGSRLLVVRPSTPVGPTTEVSVVINWFAELVDLTSVPR